MSCWTRVSTSVSFWMMLALCVLGTGVWGTGVCHGQSATRATSNSNKVEFLESSSPLPGGGRVTSRSTLGSPGIVTTVENEPGQIRSDRPQSSQQLTAENVRRWQTGGTGVQQQSGAASSGGYPYPASPIPSQIGSARSTTALASYPAFRARQNVAQSADFFAPTLGITPRNNAGGVAQPNVASGRVQRTAARLAQNCNCQPACVKNQESNLRVQGFSVPSFGNNAAATAPSLSIQEPPANLQFNPGVLQQERFNLQTPGLGVPQLNNQNQLWTAASTGTGSYQPLIRLANMQPGTYLGQGVIGQPTAYVDGQPIRNLLRYFFP